MDQLRFFIFIGSEYSKIDEDKLREMLDYIMSLKEQNLIDLYSSILFNKLNLWDRKVFRILIEYGIDVNIEFCELKNLLRGSIYLRRVDLINLKCDVNAKFIFTSSILSTPTFLRKFWTY